MYLSKTRAYVISICIVAYFLYGVEKKISHKKEITYTQLDISLDRDGNIEPKYDYVKILKSSLGSIFMDALWCLFFLFLVYMCRKMSMIIKGQEMELKFFKDRVEYLWNSAHHSIEALEDRMHVKNTKDYCDLSKKDAMSILERISSRNVSTIKKNDLKIIR